MKFIVDTHNLIWYIEGDRRLLPERALMIDSKKNKAFLSIVSLWEIAIKLSIGKLRVSMDWDQLMKQIKRGGFLFLEVKPEHMKVLLKLEHHHRDPFDRMIIAQGIAEKMKIMSSDRHFNNYNVDLL